MSSDEDEMPLAMRGLNGDARGGESDDDVPLSQRTQSSNGIITPAPLRQVLDTKMDEDEDIPLSQTVKSTPRANGAVKRPASTTAATPVKKIKTEKGPTTPKVKKENGSSKANGPATKPAKAAKATTTKPAKANGSKTAIKENGAKKENGTKAKKADSKENGSKSESPKLEDEEEDDEEQKWWERMEEDDTEKWQTLEHSGVMFPPPYEPLPKDVKLLYDSKPVDLPAEAEEVAGFFGAMLNSTNHTENEVFQQNFFGDFKQVLKECGGATCNGEKISIRTFKKMDFTLIHQHYERQRELKKAIPAAEKKKIKAEKDALEEPYKFCIIDGRKEPVGNFRIEPPGLFRGRGKHPKTGKLKRRVKPEQVTINIGKGAKVPEPPKGRQWAKVQHDNTVTWLATWKENINGNHKYVLLSHSSSMKGKSDFKKFEKARELKKHIDFIRRDYRKELDDKVMEVRQRATAMYLIDVLALRAGGEKGEDEADTVGCCSLRYEHIQLRKPNIVIFDFLGKDSIRYYQEKAVDPKVFRNLKIFKKEPKKIGDDIFDRLDPPLLNKHLQNYMPGLTAKVFRTYNATFTMQNQVDQIPNKGTVHEKVVAFNAANREVAILCNHQRTVTKGHEASVEKIGEKIKELIWQRDRHKKMILILDPQELKRDKGYFAGVDELSKEDVERIHAALYEREKLRLQKKFMRENEKLKAEGQKERPESDLEEMLQGAEELKATLALELKTGKPEVKSSATVEKLRQQVTKYEERLQTTTLQLQDKNDNSTVALSTSKMNYIDPRITVMFSKKYDVPIEKLFTKTLREKFKWAIESADKDWRF
ncbi:DNA topoisomerase 1 [Trichomonascus vanleenenianus]|uniref:DNA topoisomerase 1 n=1 Tax=Trichomonascus vanleenenianus TaxID=2268995 RepID=UPI003ECB6D1D